MEGIKRGHRVELPPLNWGATKNEEKKKKKKKIGLTRGQGPPVETSISSCPDDIYRVTEFPSSGLSVLENTF